MGQNANVNNNIDVLFTTLTDKSNKKVFNIFATFLRHIAHKKFKKLTKF